MSNQTDRLNTALAGRYRILRHLGEAMGGDRFLNPFEPTDFGGKMLWAEVFRTVCATLASDEQRVSRRSRTPRRSAIHVIFQQTRRLPK